MLSAWLTRTILISPSNKQMCGISHKFVWSIFFFRKKWYVLMNLMAEGQLYSYSSVLATRRVARLYSPPLERERCHRTNTVIRNHHNDLLWFSICLFRCLSGLPTAPYLRGWFSSEALVRYLAFDSLWFCEWTRNSHKCTHEARVYCVGRFSGFVCLLLFGFAAENR